jgi:hypothetical protein
LFSDSGAGSTVTGSVYGADPLFTEFKVWSPPGTPGFLVEFGSPALDAADRTAAPAEDQRALPRPAGDGPDIGAMEVGASSYLIAGRVLSGDTGIAGVGVLLRTPYVTAADGRFQFGPLAAGFYTVELEGGGVGFVPRLAQIPLVANATNVVFRAAEIRLAYERDALTGLGTLSAAGIPSRSYRFEGGMDLSGWQSLGVVQADSQGRVRFEHNAGSAPRWFYRVAAE